MAERPPPGDGHDAAAASSVVYRDAWSPAGWTGPAHASLFTGLRPDHHGYLRGNRMFPSPEATTLAEVLRGAGRPFFVFVNDMEPHFLYEPELAREAEFAAATVPRDERERTRSTPIREILAHNIGALPIPPAESGSSPTTTTRRSRAWTRRSATSSTGSLS